MPRAGAGWRRAQLPACFPGGAGGPLSPRQAQSGRGAPGRLRVLFLLVFWASACKGAPMGPSVLQEEKDLQLWNEIDDACSAYLARDAQLQSSNTLEELCFMVLGLLQKTQALDEKDHSKRFLFHYSKIHDSGSSDILGETLDTRLQPIAVLLPSSRPSCILCCCFFPNCMRRGRRDMKQTKSFEYLEEFKVGDTLSSGHEMGGDQLHFVKKDPNEDTEWNDILRDFKILPPKEEVKDEIEEMVLRLQKEAEVKPYEKMNLEQLKEVEDDFDEEDMKAVEMYRKRRLKELKSLQKRQRYGELREISGEQYVKEVTNAPKDVWVVIHLYQSSIPMCSLIKRHLSLLAKKFPETKFVEAVANSCIENYHDSCLPTLFVYKNGQIKAKFLGITDCGGAQLTVEELEWKLAEAGALKTDLEENPKKDLVDMMVSSVRNASIHD